MDLLNTHHISLSSLFLEPVPLGLGFVREGVLSGRKRILYPLPNTKERAWKAALGVVLLIPLVNSAAMLVLQVRLKTRRLEEKDKENVRLKKRIAQLSESLKEAEDAINAFHAIAENTGKGLAQLKEQL